MAGIMFSASKSSIQNQEASMAKFKSLNKLEKSATVDEWESFKSDSELKISDNEILIIELKVKMQNQGEIFDALYKKKIMYLEEQIKYMKARLESFEKSQSNWESFKSGFNKEINTIGEALNDLMSNNKK
jgi:hypothetical protein